MPHQDLVILFPIWACMALVTLVLTQASLGPGYSIPHLGLTLTRDLWSHSGPQTKLVTLVPARGSADTADCGLLYASPGQGDSVPHLDLHGPSDSGPRPGIIGTWILYSTPGPHFDQGPLFPLWASN